MDGTYFVGYGNIRPFLFVLLVFYISRFSLLGWIDIDVDECCFLSSSPHKYLG